MNKRPDVFKPITDEQHAAIAAAEPATREALVDSLLEEPATLEAAFLEDERTFLEHRDAAVTDAQLIQRMNNAPDMGGSIIAEHLAQETGVPAEMLRRVTKPKSVVEAVKAAVRRYGTAGRENVSNDDASGPGPSRRNFRGFDVRSLTPTPPMTEDEKAARYKAGRIAEMTEHQAGLWLLPPNPGAFGTLEQWQAWRQELLALGPETAGVYVEIQIADKVIARMRGGAE